MRRLEIEWCHLELDGKTCIRCSETGETLEKVVEQLAHDYKRSGWEIVFKETKLTADEIERSNIILFNGTPIEDILPDGNASMSECKSCCEITEDDQTCCRTVEYNGETYESIPSTLIFEAVNRVTSKQLDA